jgi:nonribosomal peptide synthetase protein BlmVI
MRQGTDTATVVHALLGLAERDPDHVAFRMLDRRGCEIGALTRGEIVRRAAGVAEIVGDASQPGTPVLLALPTGLDFVTGLFGILLAGRTAVPTPSPRSGGSARLNAIGTACGAECVLAEQEAGPLHRWRTIDPARCPPSDPSPAKIQDLAVLQYSSGSTREPRGVRISHAAIKANSAMITEVFRHGPDTDFLNWVPLFHDMGLMGGVFQPTMHGATCTLITPADFAARPSLWLEAISTYRPHTSGGPDSAYHLCAQAISEDEAASLDLSSWRVAFNGSERVQPKTMRSFSSRFASAGFDPGAFLPCYGLAEATLLVSGAHWDPLKPYARFEPESLDRGHPVISEAGREVAGLGPPAPGLELRIVDPSDRQPLSPGRIGEIALRGPTIAASYHGDPPADPEAWLYSGDLGFVHQGTLYIVGRKDDLIVQFGRNLYPDDIETAAADLVNQRGCRSAAVVIDGALVLAVEVRRLVDDPASLARTLAARFAAELSARLNRLVLLRRGDLPRTSSGKVRRRMAAGLLARNELQPLAEVDLEAESSGPVADVVAAVLGLSVETLPRDTSLSALGCQSFQALEILRRLSRDHDFTLPQGHFLPHLSIAEIEALSGSAQEAPGELAAPDPRLLVLAQYEGGDDPAALNIAFTVTAKGPDAGERLAAAAASTLGRHAALRRAPLADPSAVGGVRTVPRALPQVEPVKAPMSDIVAQVRQPFRLEREAPCRVRLYAEGSQTVLLVVIHHAAADLASAVVLARQIRAAFESQDVPAVAGVLRRPPPIPTDSAAYWAAKLADPPRPLFPNDPKRGTAKALVVEVGAEVHDRISSRAAAVGATLFEYALAGFLRAAAKIFGRERIEVLSPMSVRGPDEAELVGYGVLPVPVVADVAATPGVEGLVEDVRRQLREGAARGGLPAALALGSGGGSAQRRFDLAFLWQQTEQDPGLSRLALPGAAEVRLGDLRFSRPQGAAAAYHPIQLSVAPQSSGWLACLSYDPAVFNEDGAQRLSDAWLDALEGGLISEPRAAADDEPIAGDTLHGLFLAWAKRSPDAPALIDGESCMTYGELAAAAAKVAGNCSGSGRVAVLCSEGPAGVAAMLGALMAGAAFVGVQPSEPTLRAREVLATSGAELVLTDADGMEEGAADILMGLGLLSVEVGVDLASEVAAPPIAVDPSAPAYIAFTSGSTGRPRGMVHSHATLAGFLAWQSKTLHMGPGACMAVLAPMGFDVRYCEVFGALCHGGCAVLSRKADRLPEALGGFLARHEVTAAQLLPSAFARSTPAPARGLRALFFVGEPLPPAVLARAFEQFGPGVEISNVYGPTEVVAAAWRRLGAAEAEAGRISAGIAIPGRRLHIVDEGLERLPSGETGEILIESEWLCDGYIGEAEGGARFVPAGSRSWLAAPAFRSGDIGLFDSLGRLQVLGRRDTQIKIHGLRFDLAEIEQAISEVTGAPAAVVPREGTVAPWLEAFIESAPMEAEALRWRLLQRLPASVTPASIVFIATLPRLANGKLDRSRLAAERLAPPIPLERAAAPTGVVQDVWSAVLGEPPPHVHHNFFAAGGHSLLAMQMVNRLSAAAGRPLELADFLRDPTPARLDAMLAQSQAPPVSANAALSSEAESPAASS